MNAPVIHTVKINLPGGIIASGDLHDILNAVENAGVECIGFGNRQQLFFQVAGDQLEQLEHDFSVADIDYELNADQYPNIISSYVVEDIFENANWLREGVYKDILDLFDFKPRLKINLTDNNQTFIPFFTGNLNFIASETSNYWHLYVRFPKTNTTFNWPSLIYSEDIPQISKMMEECIFSNKDLFYDQANINTKLFEEKMTSRRRFTIQLPAQPLKLPDFQLPYYEGFNRYGTKYWLGIYRRDELFPVNFLKDLCTLCHNTRIGQLYTTPWKSVIIKSIEKEHRKLWSYILDSYRINVRHAANEMNWQIEDMSDYGLKLKYYLVQEFEKEDLRTYRLCFAIKTQPKTGLFGSIVIKPQQKEDAEEHFEILHTKDFNPNSKVYITYKREIQKANLGTELVDLCNSFYKLQCELSVDPSLSAEMKPEKIEEEIQYAYQCRNCFTIYDKEYGDEWQNIPPGTGFEQISEYRCPLCDAAKEEFILIDRMNNQLR